MLLLLATHRIHGTDGNRVQHRRNGANIVLTQKQGQQTDKGFRFPDSFTQHIV